MWCEPYAIGACLLLAAAVRCAHIRDVDNAGLLLMRCVRSPGTTRVLMTNKVMFHSVKTKPSPRTLSRYGHFRPIYEAVLGKLTIFWDRGKIN